MLNIYTKLTKRHILVEPGEYVHPILSKAFMPTYADFGIYINSGEAKDTIKKAVLSILSKYKDYIVAMPYNELYPGPYVSLGPDIAIMPKTERGVWITERILPVELLDKSNIYGHDYWGVFIARLSGIHVDGVEIVKNYEAGIIALCALGIPLPYEVSVPSYLRNQCSNERRNYTTKWQLLIRLTKSRF